MSSGPNTLPVYSRFLVHFLRTSYLMTSLHSEIRDYLTTRDQGATHKLKPRLFIKVVLRSDVIYPLPVRLANSKAGIKPTASLSTFDKKNSIEFSLDFLYYLYNYYMVCALFSHAYHVTHYVTSCDVTMTV